MDTLYHFLGGLAVALVVAYSLKNIAKVPFVARFRWATYLVSSLIYFREVTQFQTKNFESHILKGWNPWSDLYPWSLNKQLETFVPIILMLALACVVFWYQSRNG
jgi:hypothetical protein